MAEFSIIVRSLSFGIVLGTFFFVGMFMSYRYTRSFRYPSMLIFISLIWHFVVISIGLYILSSGQRIRFLSSAAGFLMATRIFIRSLRKYRF